MQTNTILDDIVAHKQKRLEIHKQAKPLSDLEKEIAQLTRKPLSFGQKVLAYPERLHVIAEIKKASPSAGIIRPDSDHRLIAREYAVSGLVDTISVITEEDFFQGSLSFLSDIRREEPDMPLLRKDFIFDHYQIYEARLAGADMILLIVMMLEDQQLSSLLSLAGELGLECLVEAHSEAELERALKAGAEIIGINSRDLKTFTIDRNLFQTLSPRIPNGVIKVAESGLETREDLIRVHEAGAHAVLIGTSLMREENISLKLRQLVP